MITEQGLVVEQKADRVWVQTVSKTSCQSCQVSSGCGTGIVNKTFAKRSFVTPMDNKLAAKVGDKVEVGIAENLIVQASLLVYLVPLVSAMLFILFCALLFEPQNEVYYMLSAGTGLLAGLMWVASRAKQLNKRHALEPVLLRIVSRPIAVKQMETS